MYRNILIQVSTYANEARELAEKIEDILEYSNEKCWEKF